jgi:hypothetical protein
MKSGEHLTSCILAFCVAVDLALLSGPTIATALHAHCSFSGDI